VIDESCSLARSDTATHTFINLIRQQNKQASNDAYLPAKVKKCGTLRMRSEIPLSENTGKYECTQIHKENPKKEKKRFPEPRGVVTMIGENRPLHKME
jgi:hypothetical protein